MSRGCIQLSCRERAAWLPAGSPHVSHSPLLPGEKKKYLPPTSRQDPKFEELQKVQQLPVVSPDVSAGGLFIILGCGQQATPPLSDLRLAGGDPAGPQQAC